MADAAFHAWTITVATGSTPLRPRSPPLRHSGGGLNVAAHHILLALYLHHGDLHLPDPQLPVPQAAALTPEAWADTAPEEIAAYLRITCRRFNTAHRPTERNTLSTQRTPLPGTPPPPRTTEAPGGLGALSGRPPGRPRRGHRHTDGPHGPAHLRQRPRDAPPRGTPLARPLPVAPTGTGGFTRPRHPPGQEDQDRSGGPPARLPAGRDAPTRALVQPHRTTPRPDPRGTPTAPPPPAPTTTTVPQHRNAAAQSATTARTHHARTTIRAEPGDMAPPTPPPRPHPSQPQPPDAPMLHRPPPATSPPRPSTTRPHEPPTPNGTHHRTTPSRIPPAPAPTTTPTNAGVPHTTSTPSTPPRRGPAPPAAPPTRTDDTRATVHPHGPAGSRARTPATPGPSRSAPPPPAAPPP